MRLAWRMSRGSGKLAGAFSVACVRLRPCMKGRTRLQVHSHVVSAVPSSEAFVHVHRAICETCAAVGCLKVEGAMSQCRGLDLMQQACWAASILLAVSCCARCTSMCSLPCLCWR